MNSMMFIVIIAGGLLILGLIYIVQRSRDKVDKAFFANRWDEIQAMYQNSDTKWVECVIEADKLVDEALKQRKFAGKTMGERMVSANRIFRDPDMVWGAHKLRNKIVHESGFKIGKKHVGYALRGFRKALKDLEVI